MSENFEKEPIFWAYLKWHYGQGLREFFGIAGNFLWFVTHFFSFKLLLKTLFAPWKRLGEHYEGGLNLSAFAETFIVNSLMRAVGFATRIIVLSVGLVSYIVVFFFSFFVLLIWILAPAILLGSAILSATFFIVE